MKTKLTVGFVLDDIDRHVTSRRYTARDERASGRGVLGTKVFYVQHHKSKWGTGRSRKYICDATDKKTAQQIAAALNKTIRP